jgi:predicted aconitase
MSEEKRRPVVHVRVKANQPVAEAVATAIGEKLGYEVIEQTSPYPCRTPNETESLIYLTIR